MSHDPGKRVARIDRREVAALPAQWTDLEKGHQLRLLLHERGIDANRLYLLTYHPPHRCWLFTQGGAEPALVAPAPGKGDDLFYRQLTADLGRTARVACATWGACRAYYQLPDVPYEITSADLVRQLGAPDDAQPAVRFTREGGWQTEPCSN
jgi:hypothetical protein